MITHQLKEKGGITKITLGTAGDKGLAITRETQRVHRIQHNILTLHEEVHQGHCRCSRQTAKPAPGKRLRSL
jgi:hypothetical protein